MYGAYTQGTSALSMHNTQGRQTVPLEVIDGGLAAAPRSSASMRSGRQRVLLILSCLMVAVFIGCFSFIQASQAIGYASQVEHAPRKTVTVHQGDTLWGIADAHRADGLTTEESMELIRTWNGLSQGVLTAGEELVVPVHQS